MATSAVTNGGAAVVPTGAAGGEASDRSDGKDKGGGSGGSSGSGGSTVSNYAGLLAALSYSFFSISITLFNKATLSSYKYDYSITLTLLQGLVTVAALEVLKYKGYVQFPALQWSVAKKVAPLAIVFLGYVVVSLVSLARVNVPMFTALRRLTILFVMVEEYFYFGTVPTRGVINSVITMSVGAGLAAWKDLTFDLVSYTYLFFTNVFTSLYTVYINVVKRDTGLNVWGLLYYNTVLTLPVLVVLAVVTGDLQAAWAFPHSRDFLFQINFQASIWLAFLLNVSTFYCTTLNTARTQTVVGQLKNFIAFLLGLVLFNDYLYDHINFFGLLVGFAGGIQYAWVQYNESQAKEAAKRAAAAALPAAAAPSASAPRLSDGRGDGEAGGSSAGSTADAGGLLPQTVGSGPHSRRGSDAGEGAGSGAGGVSASAHKKHDDDDGDGDGGHGGATFAVSSSTSLQHTAVNRGRAAL